MENLYANASVKARVFFSLCDTLKNNLLELDDTVIL